MQHDRFRKHLTAPSGALKETHMKTFILAALAALTIGLGGYASADVGVDRSNSTFPEGSIQTSAE